MLGDLTVTEIIRLFLPLIIMEVCLKMFCFYRLYIDKAKVFPKYVWLIIISAFSTIGPLSYLIVGRKKD